MLVKYTKLPLDTTAFFRKDLKIYSFFDFTKFLQIEREQSLHSIQSIIICRIPVLWFHEIFTEQEKRIWSFKACIPWFHEIFVEKTGEKRLTEAEVSKNSLISRKKRWSFKKYSLIWRIFLAEQKKTLKMFLCFHDILAEYQKLNRLASIEAWCKISISSELNTKIMAWCKGWCIGTLGVIY